MSEESLFNIVKRLADNSFESENTQKLNIHVSYCHDTELEMFHLYVVDVFFSGYRAALLDIIKENYCEKNI